MSVIIDEKKADEILLQYYEKYPEYWMEMKKHQAFWVMLRDKSLPRPDDIPTDEMIEFTNSNHQNIREFIRKIELYGNIEPGKEPSKDFSDTCRFLKERMELQAQNEITKEIKDV